MDIRRPQPDEPVEFLDLILRCLPAFVVAVDRDLRFTAIRGRVLEHLGFDARAITGLIGTPAQEYFAHSSGPAIIEHVRAALKGKSTSFEAEWEGRYFTAHVAPLRSRQGSIVGVVGAGMDITRRRSLEKELEAERKALDDAQQVAEVGSWTLDIASGRVRISAEMARLLGIPYSKDLMHFSDFERHFQPNEFRMLQAEQERVLHTCGAYDFDHDLVRMDGSVRHVRSRGHVECSRDGKPLRCTGTILDITARVEAQRTVELLAYHDSLTGLPNRSLLRDRLGYAIASSRREQNKLYVLFIDLDAFKRINDSLGHAEGDVLLAEVAQRLRNAVRATDTVARTGGDEFVILLTEIHTEDDLETAINKVRAVFRAPFRLRDGDHAITASIGIAAYPDDALTEDELLKDADSAMYDAKQRGRNTVRRYHGTSLASTVRRVQLEVDLPRALRDTEFRIHYQPIVHARTLQIVGVEALLRWQHPSRGLLSPASFLDAIEDSEYVKVIGEWVIREAATQVASWREHFGLPLRLSVNVSARQLLRTNFPRVLAGALRTANLSPEAVDLEIAETTLVRDLEWAATVLSRIRELGAGIAIDDFGTGYNSLSYLKHFPVTALKIDRSFVGEIGVDAFDEAISSAVAALGKALHMRVVAEGVETHRQLEFAASAWMRRTARVLLRAAAGGRAPRRAFGGCGNGVSFPMRELPAHGDPGYYQFYTGQYSNTAADRRDMHGNSEGAKGDRAPRSRHVFLYALGRGPLLLHRSGFHRRLVFSRVSARIHCAAHRLAAQSFRVGAGLGRAWPGSRGFALAVARIRYQTRSDADLCDLLVRCGRAAHSSHDDAAQLLAGQCGLGALVRGYRAPNRTAAACARFA